MNTKEEQTCRLCLKVVKDELELNEVMRQVLEILLLKLDLNISRDPIFCQNCMDVAKKCLHFKYTFINTEEFILSYSAERKQIKHDIKVIYERRKHVRTALDQDFNVCRFCLSRLERYNFSSLETLMNESPFDMLSEYVVEMDFNTIENSVVCPNCKESLDGYFKFVLKCLDIEEKIKAYWEKKGTDTMGQVKLSNVLHFVFPNALEYPSKIYKVQQEHTPCIYPEAYIKLIKHEEVDYISADRNIWPMYKCSLCTYESKQKNCLRTHMLIHKSVSKIEMYKCSLCSYETKHKSSINTHMLIHKDVSEIKMYKCSLCTYEGKYKGNLKSHMLIHKDVSEIKMFKCSLCTYEAKQKISIKRHMLVHKDVSEIKMYKCPLCVYETKRKTNLTSHMLVHNGVSELKMYKCSICTYEAKQKSNLIRHMLIHKDISKIKMYKCSLCTYETKHKMSLNRHMLVHKDVSEIRMYKCSMCTYEAKRKDNLTTHMFVHKDIADIKMYKCSLCSYEAKRKCSLTTHMLVHKDISEINMYKCSVGTYEAKQKSNLTTQTYVG